MAMTHRLLFGDDGSVYADAAWLWINSHNWPGWAIDVVNAADDHPVSLYRELLRGTVAQAVHVEQITGDPRWVLHKYGHSRDLIVVGSRGQGLMKRLHLGSTSEWLMHGPPAPLVIVRSGHRTKRALLAHDGSGHAHSAERALSAMPWIGEVTIKVLVVAEQRDPVTVAEEAAKRLAEVAGEVTVEVLQPDELQVFYRPRDVILEAACSWQPDLIALGSRGLTAWESLNEIGLHRAGSTASAIAQHANCNVLLATG